MLERAQLPARVDRDADGIEAQLRGMRSVTALREPGGGHESHPAPLALVQGVEREAGAGTPRLDFAEDQPVAVVADQVELAPARAVISLDDLKAPPLEVDGGGPLTLAPQPLA